MIRLRAQKSCVNMVNTLLCRSVSALQTAAQVSFTISKALFSANISRLIFTPLYWVTASVRSLTKSPGIRIWPDTIWISVLWVVLSSCTKKKKKPKQSSAWFDYLMFLLWDLTILQLKMKVICRTCLQLYAWVKKLRLCMWRQSKLS